MPSPITARVALLLCPLLLSACAPSNTPAPDAEGPPPGEVVRSYFEQWSRGRAMQGVAATMDPDAALDRVFPAADLTNIDSGQRRHMADLYSVFVRASIGCAPVLEAMRDARTENLQVRTVSPTEAEVTVTVINDRNKNSRENNLYLVKRAGRWKIVDSGAGGVYLSQTLTSQWDYSKKDGADPVQVMEFVTLQAVNEKLMSEKAPVRPRPAGAANRTPPPNVRIPEMVQPKGDPPAWTK